MSDSSDSDAAIHVRSIRNSGGATAHDVHVRVGSAANMADVNRETRAASVAHGEVVPILITPPYGSAPDYAVSVTWRGRFGRRGTWTHFVL